MRRLALIHAALVLCLAPVAGHSGATPGATPGATAGATEDACTDLVLDYAYYRDQLNAARVADLFTADATLTVLGESFAGRDAIHDRLAGNPGAPLTRHMMSTIRIFADGPDRATGVSYVTVYLAPRADLPVAVQGFAGIGEYHDEFVRTPAGWKIRKRTFMPVFTQPGD